MKTSKNIATISYNTPQFLESKLNEFIKSGAIAYWVYIVHKGETIRKGKDKGNKGKDHIHLFIQPAKPIDTTTLTLELRELIHDENGKHQLVGIDKDIKPSDFSNWYLYNKHDKNYLIDHRAGTREYHYSDNDFITSDYDTLSNLVNNIDYKGLTLESQIDAAIKKGIPWEVIVHNRLIPTKQIRQYKEYYMCAHVALQYELKEDYKHLLDAQNEELYNLETGEIIE